MALFENMNWNYKLLEEKKADRNVSDRVAYEGEENLDVLSPENYAIVQLEFESVLNSLRSEDASYAAHARFRLKRFARDPRIGVRMALVESPFFPLICQSLCASDLLFLIRHVAMKSCSVICSIIMRTNVLPTVFASLFSNTGRDMDFSLRILASLHRSGFIVSLGLYCSGIFDHFKTRLAIPMKRPELAWMAGLTESLIQILHEREATFTLDELQCFPSVSKMALQDFLNQGLHLDDSSSLWYCLVFFAGVNDSVVIVRSLKSMLKFCNKPFYAQFVFGRTRIFECFSDFCSRNNSEVLVAALKLVAQLCYCLYYHVHERLVANGIPQAVLQIFLERQEEGVEVMALRSLSNFWMMCDSEFQEQLWKPEFLGKLLRIAESDQFQLRSEVVWFLMNLGNARPELMMELARNEDWMKFLIDCLQGFDKEVVAMVINGLDTVFERDGGAAILEMFVREGGLDVLGQLMESEGDVVNVAAEVLYDKLTRCLCIV
jgi:hypothetical protein